jgi:hypothetical protein
MGAKGNDVALAQLVSDLMEEDEILGERRMAEMTQKPLNDL